jgi:integrase
MNCRTCWPLKLVPAFSHRVVAHLRGISGRFWHIDTSLRALKKRGRLIVKFAVLTRLRPGEILGLKWRHLPATKADIRQRVYRGHIDTPKRDLR